MREYPSEFALALSHNVCVSISCAFVSLFVEENNPSAWIMRSKIMLICIVATGVVNSTSYVVESWTVRYKGAVFLAMFRPLSIVTAVVLGAIFLGDSLYLGRSSSLPPLSVSILSKIGLLGFLGSMYVITGYIGIEYSSPTLASAINNITPALTFILAIIFRMEKVSFKERSSLAKLMGTILSLIGALVVIFYHGPRVFLASSPPYVNFRQFSPPLSSSNSDWLIGGALLTMQGIFVSVSFILQAHIMSVYPAAFRVSFLYTVCVSIVTSTIGLVVEKNNPSVWIIHFDITLITIVTMAIVTSVYYVIHSWTVRHKGPLYLAIFKPLSILIAVVMGAIFLNDSLYLGCLIGGILITLGFYAVMWGKANEEKDQLSFSEKEKTPLLLNRKNDQV